jgi:hypothetical protein
MRARSHVSTILKLTLVSACAAMVFLWPNWRAALANGGYYQEGRMTGGGNCTVDDIKVTHGFELHCDASGSNNLEVNWQDQTGSHRFHLDALLEQSITCPPDSSDLEEQPVAGFNTYMGSGTGTFDGSSPAIATWVFRDLGEPGKDNDTLVITIVTESGTVLNIPFCTLEGGNHQAHPE